MLLASHDHFALQFLRWKMLWNPPIDIKSHTCKNIISRYVLWASVGFVKASKIFFRATISPVLLPTLFHTMPYACNNSEQLSASICYAAQWIIWPYINYKCLSFFFFFLFSCTSSSIVRFVPLTPFPIRLLMSYLAVMCTSISALILNSIRSLRALYYSQISACVKSLLIF